MLRVFLVTQALVHIIRLPRRHWTVSVVQDGVARPSPLTGFGTEFVFQTNSDVNLNQNLLKAGSRMCRYPGGTPSDYWLWDLGWVNVSSDHSGSGKLPFQADDAYRATHLPGGDCAANLRVCSKPAPEDPRVRY